MENVFENLFSDYYIKDKINSKSVNKLEMEIGMNEKRLKRNFSKKQVMF